MTNAKFDYLQISDQKGWRGANNICLQERD